MCTTQTSARPTKERPTKLMAISPSQPEKRSPKYRKASKMDEPNKKGDEPYKQMEQIAKVLSVKMKMTTKEKSKVSCVAKVDSNDNNASSNKSGACFCFNSDIPCNYTTYGTTSLTQTSSKKYLQFTTKLVIQILGLNSKMPSLYWHE